MRKAGRQARGSVGRSSSFPGFVQRCSGQVVCTNGGDKKEGRDGLDLDANYRVSGRANNMEADLVHLIEGSKFAF